MKKSLRFCVLLALAAAQLTVSAFADTGPKPQLTVRVSHPPEELYYLDLLERDEPGSKIYGGFSWGSNTPDPLDQELLDALRPEVAVISVGLDNRYGHPAAGTLERLSAAGAEIYRTDLYGTVTFRAGS